MNTIVNPTEKANSTVEEVNDLVSDYLSGLSHDIRTPLSAIIGFSDLLTEPWVSRAEQNSYCLMIGRSSRKLLDLMSNLIDLAKIQTGNLEFFNRIICLKDFVEEVKLDMNEMVRLYEKNDLVMSYVAPANASASVNTDRARLFQIVKILMGNSLQYTKKGGVSLIITQDTSSSSCIIEISDTGCGMSKETVDNLFVMFPSSDILLSKKMKARGMSLCVAKNLCDRMNITIEVTSELGTGTTIRLTLPGKSS